MFAEAGLPEAARGGGNTHRLHLRNNEEFAGGMEFCDAHFIRLTRKQTGTKLHAGDPVPERAEEDDFLSRLPACTRSALGDSRWTTWTIYP